MKKYSLLLTLLLAVYIFPACNDGTGTADDEDTTATTGMNDEDNAAGMDNDTSAQMGGLSNDDTEFMTNAADGGMAEVEMSRLAQQKATNADVKSFASMMVTDHTKANDELKSLAATKNVTLPATISDKHREHMDDLSQKSGSDFDKAYINHMVDDHQKDVDMFDKAANRDNGDADVKAWAAKTLPTLRKHLDEVKRIDDMMKK